MVEHGERKALNSIDEESDSLGNGCNEKVRAC